MLYRAAALASVGFCLRYGCLMMGASVAEKLTLRRAERINPIIRSPGVPRDFILTQEKMCMPTDSRVCCGCRPTPNTGGSGAPFVPLRRHFGPPDLSVRLHQLVRAIEGLLPIPASPDAVAVVRSVTGSLTRCLFC